MKVLHLNKSLIWLLVMLVIHKLTQQVVIICLGETNISSWKSMYGNIPDLPWSTPSNPPLLGSHATNGIIGSVSQKSKNKKENSKNVQVSALSNSPGEAPSPRITFEINVVRSSTNKAKSSRNKKNGKGKTK